MENDEEEIIVKVDASELLGDPKMFRIAKEDIERIRFSDGCVGCKAMRQGKTAQRRSDHCRRRVQEDLRSNEECRDRLDKAEERFTEAFVRAGERMECMGMKVGMNLGK